MMDSIRRDIHELDERQSYFIDHFEEFRSQIQDVTNSFLNLRSSNGGEITDENLAKEELSVQLGIDKNENALQSIRRVLNEDDKVSQAIRKSHLFATD